MSFRIRLSEEAQSDYDRAFAHFVAIHAQLGGEFSEVVDEMPGRLSESPMLYAEIKAGVRMAVFRRFSHGLIYAIDGDDVVILSVFHTRRNLNAWLDALDN